MNLQTRHVDNEYLNLARHIIDHGTDKGDRTGTGTRSVFGYQMRFDLSKGFPALTTKRLPLRLIWEELEWFLAGNTNAASLTRRNVGIWTPDAYRWYKEQGQPHGEMTFDEFKEWLEENDFDLGPIYGHQWRSWPTQKQRVTRWNIGVPVESEFITIDQITNVIEQIKTNPDSRRLIVSAWNPSDLDEMALPPCHILFQFYVADGKLSCQLYQRSGDIFLGVPFNIASYAMLTHLIAAECDLEVGEFVHTLGDAHIYNNHFEQIQEQLSRKPRELPKFIIRNKKDSIFDYRWEDIDFEGYDPHPVIKGRVSVG